MKMRNVFYPKLFVDIKTTKSSPNPEAQQEGGVKINQGPILNGVSLSSIKIDNSGVTGKARQGQCR